MDEEEAPKPYRHRHDGLTPARRTLFLARLRETGCVADACRAVGISGTTARRAKKRIPEFADGWDMALSEERPVLRQAAFKRAVFGVDEPLVSGGKLLGVRKRYSDGLLRLLIQQDEARRGARLARWVEPAPADEVRETILKRVAAVKAARERDR